MKMPVGMVGQMAALYQCTEQAIYNALAFKSDSLAAQKIRKEAVELYGGVVTSKVVFVEDKF